MAGTRIGSKLPATSFPGPISQVEKLIADSIEDVGKKMGHVMSAGHSELRRPNIGGWTHRSGWPCFQRSDARNLRPSTSFSGATENARRRRIARHGGAVLRVGPREEQLLLVQNCPVTFEVVAFLSLAQPCPVRKSINPVFLPQVACRHGMFRDGQTAFM